MMRLGFATAIAAAAMAQPGLHPGTAAEPDAPHNLDFEAGAMGEAPADWSLAQDSRIAGYGVQFRKEGCRTGAGCAVIVAGPNVQKGGEGTLLQRFDGSAYREKTMRLSAWVRL